jgi:hypothetical protein
MAGCLGMSTVSFARCPQPTTSHRRRQVFQIFLNLTEQPIVLISIQLEIMILILGSPSRDPRSDPPRPPPSSCHHTQILKYPPLAKPKYNYPHAPHWSIPSPIPPSLTVSRKGSGVAQAMHSLASLRVDQFTDQ